MRVVAPAIVLAAALLLVAGCGGSSKQASQDTSPPATSPQATTTAATQATPAPKPSKSTSPVNKCVPVPDQVVRRIESNIILLGARLTNFRAVTTRRFPNIYFISAHLAGARSIGSLATWASFGLNGTGSIFAMDGVAALISNFGGAIGKSASLTIDAPGVYHSRVCVAGPSAPHGVSAPPGGGTPRPN